MAAREDFMNVTVTPQPFAWVLMAFKYCFKLGQIILLPFRIIEGFFNILAGLVLAVIIAGTIAFATGYIKIPDDFMQKKMEQVFRMIDPEISSDTLQKGLENLKKSNHPSATKEPPITSPGRFEQTPGPQSGPDSY